MLSFRGRKWSVRVRSLFFMCYRSLILFLFSFLNLQNINSPGAAQFNQSKQVRAFLFHYPHQHLHNNLVHKHWKDFQLSLCWISPTYVAETGMHLMSFKGHKLMGFNKNMIWGFSVTVKKVNICLTAEFYKKTWQETTKKMFNISTVKVKVRIRQHFFRSSG